MRTVFFLSSFLVLLACACNKQAPTDQENFEYEKVKQPNAEINEVLYSMYLPTDMAGLFASTGTNFDPTIPASIEDITLYTNPEQIAVMLGIYGVDLTYMKLLEQSLLAAQYYKIIESLSARIDIPESVFRESSKQLEAYFENEDSLASVIEEIYRQTDQFFKASGRDNLAALSLAGGWLEAMYIGISIFDADRGNSAIAERILQQKYSLNSIYVFLSNYQESLSVKSYLLMLKKLRKVFEGVDIRYQKEGFSVDTSQKKLQAYSAHIRYDEKTMDDLIRVISQIREEFLTPKE